MFYLIYFLALTVLLLLYLKIASYYDIVDQPNVRSSHDYIPVRGGGIIFPTAILSYEFITGFNYPFVCMGLFIISLVSFIDDVQPLSTKIRILGHVTAVTLLFWQAELFDSPFWVVSVSYVIFIGTINAYNFMDGINGITVGYSLITVGAMWYVNQNQIHFLEAKWLSLTSIALMVFIFFNFRKRAKCFLGDVGSVSLAFILIFFILLLVIETKDCKYMGFLLLYGLDSVSTIFFRLLRKENIFEPHRSHFYQYLANRLHWPHVAVALCYMLVQLIANIFIISTFMDGFQILLFFVAAGIFFVGVRYLVEGRDILFSRSDAHPATEVS